MHTGLLIALEGIDGAGTSTQLPRLAAHLHAAGHATLCTAQPSTGPIGRLLRGALGGRPALDEASLALLFAADRLAHLQAEILPALAAQQLVLTDRYLLSSLAYQGSALPPAWVAEINSRAPPADLSLYFRVDPEVAAQRRQQRGGPAEHFDAAQRQAQVAAGYEQALHQRPMDRICVVDANANVDAVAHAVHTCVDAFIAERSP